MHRLKSHVLMADTDASGNIFFGSIFRMMTEVYEEFLREKGFGIRESILKRKVTLPFVHVEADYFRPLELGDQIELQLVCEEIGRTSFHLLTRVFKYVGKNSKVEASQVRTIHVWYDVKKGKKMSIPRDFRRALEKISVKKNARQERRGLVDLA